MDFTNKASQFVGLAEDQARDKGFQEGFAVRVTNRDGNPMVVTRDYRIDRINITVVKGKVTKADIG